MKMPFRIKSNKVSSAQKVSQGISRPKNNTWYCFSPSSDTTIVFVHGLLSDASSCWRAKSGHYWPEIVREDKRFDDPSIFLAGYHTAYDSTTYKIRDCAEEVIRALEREDDEGRPGPMCKPNILFVCHSLGGIVARYVLEAHTSKFASKTVGILLMASPSIGSEYADSFAGLINFYRNGIARQLKYLNDSLTDLDHRFKLLIEERRIESLVGAEAVEHHSLLRIPFLPSIGTIVSQESASRYFGNSQRLAGTNHSTIVKPESKDNPSHLFLHDFFVRKFKPLARSRTGPVSLPRDDVPIVVSHQIQEAPGLPLSRILFDIYSPECEQYYFERNIDTNLQKALALCSVWVSGPSGCGKTSAVRHLVHRSGSRPVEVCLALYEGRLNEQQIVEEILLTAQQALGLGVGRPLSIATLTKVLAQHAAMNPIVLYIDEIPASESDREALCELVNLIATLLDSIKHSSGNENVRFLVSSIGSPSMPTSAVRSKFGEQMRAIGLPLWSDQELARLLARLVANLELPPMKSVEVDEVVKVAAGLPRFVKAYLRNKLISPQSNSQELLELTAQQIVV